VVTNPFSPDRKQEIGKTRQELTEDFARQHWEETGKHKGLQGSAPREGDEASVVKPYRERLAEDIEYRKGVDTGYADRMGGLREDYLSELGNSFVDRQRANKMYGRRMKGVTDDLVGTIRGATEDWRQGAGEMKQAVKPLANRAPVNVSLGDFSMPFTTGSQRHAQSTLQSLINQELQNRRSAAKDIYGARGSLMDLYNRMSHNTQDYRDRLNQQRLDQRGQQAGLEREVGQAYTPNMAENMYMQFLNNLVQATEDRRYRTPTQTTTGELPDNTWQNINAGIDMGESLGQLIKQFMNKQKIEVPSPI
jgi:hypothetical protein